MLEVRSSSRAESPEPAVGVVCAVQAFLSGELQIFVRRLQPPRSTLGRVTSSCCSQHLLWSLCLLKKDPSTSKADPSCFCLHELAPYGAKQDFFKGIQLVHQSSKWELLSSRLDFNWIVNSQVCPFLQLPWHTQCSWACHCELFWKFGQGASHCSEHELQLTVQVWQQRYVGSWVLLICFSLKTIYL